MRSSGGLWPPQKRAASCQKGANPFRRGRCSHRPAKLPVTAMLWGRIPFFPPPSVCRQVARRARSPALQCKANGRRNRKLRLCGRRFFSRHPFAGERRAGVHARRETFRQSQRFRADENHRLLRSTTRREGPLRRGRCSHRPAKLPVTAMLWVHIRFSPPPSACRRAARRARSPALQYKANGRRNRKLCLCGRRFFSRHPFAGERRAGVHARRETFRQSRRFRADEITAARRRRFRGSPARSAGVRAGDRPLRSTSRSAPALRGGRPNPRFHPLTPIRREVHPARPGRYPAVNRRRSLCQTSSA